MQQQHSKQRGEKRDRLEDRRHFPGLEETQPFLLAEIGETKVGEHIDKKDSYESERGAPEQRVSPHDELDSQHRQQGACPNQETQGCQWQRVYTPGEAFGRNKAKSQADRSSQDE